MSPLLKRYQGLSRSLFLFYLPPPYFTPSIILFYPLSLLLPPPFAREILTGPEKGVTGDEWQAFDHAKKVFRGKHTVEF
jgi:hypothetical protein